MNRKLAINIFNNIIEYSKYDKQLFKIRHLDKSEYINGFHQWVDGKYIVGIINLSDMNNSYYFVFIDWTMNGKDYYIVILSKNKVTIFLELHNIKDEYGSANIEWRYKPSKRDGRNEERKNCFKSYYGDIIKRIEVPTNMYGIEEFLSDTFYLLNKRIESDRVVFKEEFKVGFPEGRLYERVHKERERSGKLVELVKRERWEKEDKLACEICGFDFYKVYKEVGRDFIEAHHTIPVSELTESSETKKEDIILVCSNCHSMLHRRRPWLTVDDIKKLIE